MNSKTMISEISQTNNTNTFFGLIPSVVKAAYRSGNPAFGVGPGNAPVLVDDTADIALAAKRIVASKSFDNSVNTVGV